MAKATLDISRRRYKNIQYFDERITLPDYEGELRQVAVKGLGREHPTLFLLNHFDVTVRDFVANYTRRNGVEDALGNSVNFFHLDCLSSELTVLANGCYHWLASRLHGFSKAKPKSVYRKFVETSGAIKFERGRRIVVYLDRRSHNPILREAELGKDAPKIPWLANHRIEFVYT